MQYFIEKKICFVLEVGVVERITHLAPVAGRLRVRALYVVQPHYGVIGTELKPLFDINPFDTLTYPYRVRAVFCNLNALCRNLKENSNNYYFMPTNKFHILK